MDCKSKDMLPLDFLLLDLPFLCVQFDRISDCQILDRIRKQQIMAMQGHKDAPRSGQKENGRWEGMGAENSRHELLYSFQIQTSLSRRRSWVVAILLMRALGVGYFKHCRTLWLERPVKHSCIMGRSVRGTRASIHQISLLSPTRQSLFRHLQSIE